MTIKEQLREEFKDAMRAKDAMRLDVLRQIETEVSKAKSAPGFSGEVDDTLYQDTIAAYSKRMSKAINEYEALGPRTSGMVEKLSFEVDYLKRWLPTRLDEGQTRELVRAAIAELGVTGPQAAGRVVGHVMKSHRDEVDGTIVKRIATEELSG